MGCCPPKRLIGQHASRAISLVSARSGRTPGVTTMVGASDAYGCRPPWVEQNLSQWSLGRLHQSRWRGILLAILAMFSPLLGRWCCSAKERRHASHVLSHWRWLRSAWRIWNSVAILRDISQCGVPPLLLNAIGTGVYVGRLRGSSRHHFAGGLLACVRRVAVRR